MGYLISFVLGILTTSLACVIIYKKNSKKFIDVLTSIITNYEKNIAIPEEIITKIKELLKK